MTPSLLPIHNPFTLPVPFLLCFIYSLLYSFLCVLSRRLTPPESQLFITRRTPLANAPEVSPSPSSPRSRHPRISRSNATSPTPNRTDKHLHSASTSAMPAKKIRCTFKECTGAAQRIVGDCAFCNGHYCGKHRLLEDHKCEGLEDVSFSPDTQWWRVGLFGLVAGDDSPADALYLPHRSARRRRMRRTQRSLMRRGRMSSRVFKRRRPKAPAVCVSDDRRIYDRPRSACAVA